MKKPALITSFLVVVILILSVIQIIVSNSLSTSGIQLSRLQAEIQNYNRQNYTLQEKLLTRSSYSNIASEAATVGFVSSKTVVTISNSLPIAIKR